MSKDISSISIQDIGAKARKLGNVFKRYAALSLFILVIGAYSFTVFEINRLVNSQPSEEKIAEKLQTTTVPRIDEQTMMTIQNLEDQNIKTQAIFDQARQNPFAE